MTSPLAWGVLGTGIIANIFAQGLRALGTGALVAVGSRTQAAADRFGEKYAIARCHGSYGGLLADEDVQAVYISTPHALHAEWAIKAAKAGKHILCEKPLAINYREAMSIIEAARRNDVFLMEAFMYRCHPQTTRLIELLRSGMIGKIHAMQVTFSFHTPFHLENRLLNYALGGGSILDVGCYCTSMARLIAGTALGQDCAEPDEVVGAAHIGVLSHVDEYAVASLTFPGGILAQLFAGVQVMGNNVVHIFGSEGSILVPKPWVPEGEHSTIVIKRNDEQRVQEISVESRTPLYTLEAATVAEYIETRQAPAMNWQDTLGNMKTLDRWRASVGMSYAADLI
ncbi:MAG: Gfo/Idh/MocA family oxidoreductase [Ktedonobacteraceae bacterium]|nr:Gfo/Idh/MocA family oxidoreductase [Ktedonobacteraceae bacterium]